VPALDTPIPFGDTVQATTEVMHQLRGHFTKLNLNPDDLAIVGDNGKRSKDTLPSFDPQIRTKIPSSHPPSAEKRKLASIGTPIGQDMILGLSYAYDGNTLQLGGYHCLSAGLRGSCFNFLNLTPPTFESFYIGVQIFTTFSTDLLLRL
jgi:hypothetical protein